jgi:fatty acid desaturase
MKTKTAIIVLTVYLTVYIGLFAADLAISGFSYLLLIAPVLLVLVVCLILIDDVYKYPELTKKDWTYRDKAKDKLGLF